MNQIRFRESQGILNVKVSVMELKEIRWVNGETRLITNAKRLAMPNLVANRLCLPMANSTDLLELANFWTSITHQLMVTRAGPAMIRKGLR